MQVKNCSIHQNFYLEYQIWQIVQKFSGHGVMEEYVQTDETNTTKGYSNCNSANLSTMNVSRLTRKQHNICIETFRLLITEMRSLGPVLVLEG